MRRCVVLLFTLLLFLMSKGQVLAQEASVDRTAMVTAAHERFFSLLRYFQQQRAYEDLGVDDRSLIGEILSFELEHQASLVFTDDPEKFETRLGEKPRLMSTEPNVLGGTIWVNNNLLNSPSGDGIQLIVLFQAIFHEYGHKTSFGGDHEWGMRDRVARIFGEQIQPLVSTHQLEKGIVLEILSIPPHLITQQVVEVSINRPQKVNLILLTQYQTVIDLSDIVESRVGEVATNLRGIHPDLNQALYSVGSELMRVFQVMQDAMMEMMGGMTEKLGLKNIKDPDPIYKELRELRNLHIKSVDQLGDGDLLLRGAYTVYRTNQNNLLVSFTGMEMEEKTSVGLEIRIPIDFESAEVLDTRISVAMMPTIDVDREAEVASVIRNGSNMKVKIKIPRDIYPHSVALQVQYGSGYLSIQPELDGEMRARHYIATFVIPEYITNNHRQFVADSVKVDTETSLYLNRVIELNEPVEGQEIQIQEPTQLVEDSLGIWGRKDGEDYFQREFSHSTPAIFMDNLNGSHFSIGPSQFIMDFVLTGTANVREVRVHGSRMILLTKIDEDTESQATLEFYGQRRRFAEGKTVAGLRTAREIFTITDPSSIIQQSLPGGRQRFRVGARVPYLFVKPEAELAADEANFISLYVPSMVQIITDRFETVTHHFGSAIPEPKCEKLLQGLDEYLKNELRKRSF